MKRYIIAIILLFAAQGWGANLMPNGSFEEGSWNINYQAGLNAGQSIQSAITTEQAKTGTHSLKIMNWNDTAFAGGGIAKIDTKLIRLVPNTQYTFSVYFKVTTAAASRRIGMAVSNACRAQHSISSVADVDGSHITVTTGTHHQLTTGEIILIDGTAGDIYEGQYAVTVTGDHTFTVHAVYSASTTGTVYVSSFKTYSDGVALLTPANSWNKSAYTFTTGQSTTHPFYFFTLYNNNPNSGVNIPIYIDDIQVETGAVQSDPPVTMANVEVGVKMTSGGVEVIGNIYNDENPVMEFNVFNSSGGSLTKTIKYEVVNQYLGRIATGSFSETIAAGALATHNVTLTGLKYGTHSVISWIDEENGTMSETVFAYLPAIRTATVDTNGVFGIHSYTYPDILSQSQKMGMKWERSLSPWAFERWSAVEATKDTFTTTIQTSPQNLSTAGLTALMTLGHNSSTWPTWAHWHGSSADTEIVAATDTLSCTACAGGALSDFFDIGDRIAVMSTVAADVNDTFTVESVNANTLVVNEDLTTEGHAGTTTILNLSHWNDYVSWVMTNYGTYIKYYEVWNEPGGDTVLVNCPKCLSRAVKMARDTADSVGGGIKLVGWGDQEWAFRDATITALLALDVAKPDLDQYLDGVFTYHMYDETNNSAADSAAVYVPNDVWGWNTEAGQFSYPFSLLDYQESYHRSNGAGWSTLGEDGETYWPKSSWENAGAMVGWNFFNSVRDHSSKYFYYDLKNYPAEYYNEYSAVDSRDVPKPMGVTLATLAHFFDVPTEFGELVTTGAGVTYIYYSWIDAGGKAWAILWKTDDAISQVTVTQAPANYLAYDIYGNPVTIAGTVTSTFPFSKTPILIKAVAYTEANMKTYFTVAGGATYAAKTDTTPPRVVVTNRHLGQGTNGVTTRFRFRAQDWMESVPDDLAPTRIQYQYKMNGGGITMADYSTWSEAILWYDAVFTATSDYVFQVQVKDAAGNISGVEVRNGEIITGVHFTLQ
jgi:hypothetical protein